MKNSIKKAQIVFAITIIGIFTASNVLAYSSQFFSTYQDKLPSGAGITDISGIINIVKYVLQTVYVVFFIISIIYILLAAYTYLSRSSDPAKISEVHSRLKWAAIAIAVALISVGINLIVKDFISSGSSTSNSTSVTQTTPI